jgi:thiol-disulfide isomerase/thioredoxin
VKARPILAVLAACAVVALLTYGLLHKGTAKIAVGDPVPDRELPVLNGTGQGDIAEHRGEWVLVNLWASWCPPCRQEAPTLERFYRQHKAEGVKVVGINVQDNEDDALAFLHEFHSTYPQLRSVGAERSEAFGANGVPDSFLVNPRGRLALIWPLQVDEKVLREQFDPLIEGKGAGGQ